MMPSSSPPNFDEKPPLLKTYAVCKRSDRIERASAGIVERFITVLLPNYKHG
jgi:hypothetical protein